jgi:protein-tyrosine phosphatase
VIDLHCHVLPGIDDGPKALEGSLAMARAALEAGIDTLVATPHVNARCANDADTIARLTAELNASLAAESIELRVLPGAEIAVSHLAEIEPAELSRLGLGGSRWLLVEPPFTLVAMGLEAMLLDLQRAGYQLVLAHPERCPALHRDRRIVKALVEAGVLMSITAGSLAGRFGGEVRSYAMELAREGLIHNVTSDAHDTVRRPPGIAAELQRAGLEPLADWLTTLVPEAVLGDADIPPRPAATLKPSRSRLRAFRRAW